MSTDEKKVEAENENILFTKKPSKKTDGKYAILMETSVEECESWYYFIRVQDNEDALKHLSDQFEKIDWEIIDDLSTFELDLEYLVSAQTAKEMSKVSLNYYSDHRKFDGKLKKIDFDFKKKDGNETKICKVFDVLSFGQIEEYISDEDVTDIEDSSEDEDGDSTDKESYSESSTDDEDYSSKKNEKIPPSILREKLRQQIKDDKDARKKGTKVEKINYDE